MIREKYILKKLLKIIKDKFIEYDEGEGNLIRIEEINDNSKEKYK
jgi:hypothetical protein